MTSNLGSQLISQKVGEGFEKHAQWDEEFSELKQELHALLKKSIRPEFLNRIDEVIVFKPLAQSDIREIVAIQLQRVIGLLSNKSITLVVNDEAKDWLAKLGFDPQYGARPLKRVIQKHITNAMSEKILAGEFGEGDTVEVVLDRQGLIEFHKR
jgi:ATP-dependent Clp protease ATP-binding subunit ClpB